MANIAPIFIDIEFTALDPDENEIWEIGWILDVQGQTVSCQNWLVEHTTQASEWVLKNTSYKERILKPRNAGISLPILREALLALIEDIKLLVPKDYEVYMYGACPWYDIEYLRRAFKKENLIQPFHWRVIDIESMAFGYLKGQGIEVEKPWPTAKIMKHFGLTESNDKHTTNGDNEEVRKIYNCLTIK